MEEQHVMAIPEQPKPQERPITPVGAGLGIKVKKSARILWLIVQYGFDRLADATGDNVQIIRKEAGLFLGLALTVIGVMNFHNGKNCDGNTVDYLSCTRPSTFYYYTVVEMFLVTLGISLMLVWLLRRFPSKHH